MYNLVTFKDLKKRVSLETTMQQQSRLTERLHNKPFWIWDIKEHKQEDVRTNGLCCFNHIIGLPQKDGIDRPLYDYQRMIFGSLVTHNGNTRQQQQQRGRGYLQCSKGCGQEIYFDANNKSQSGKFIPLDKGTGLPHQCQ